MHGHHLYAADCNYVDCDDGCGRHKRARGVCVSLSVSECLSVCSTALQLLEIGQKNTGRTSASSCCLVFVASRDLRLLTLHAQACYPMLRGGDGGLLDLPCVPISRRSFFQVAFYFLLLFFGDETEHHLS